MKKITIITLLLLSSTLFSDMFEYNTDAKSKYEFNIKKTKANIQMAETLEMFQSGNASDEDIQKYLEASDSNNSINFAMDVMVDKTLRRENKNLEPIQKVWYLSLYDSIFSDKKSIEDSIEIENLQELTPTKKQIPTNQGVE